MARRYSRGASKDVERAMRKRKRGTLKSGRSGKKVKSRKQAIAIACRRRAERQKVPKAQGSLTRSPRRAYSGEQTHSAAVLGLHFLRVASNPS